MLVSYRPLAHEFLIANDWYDVKAGSDVEILILNTALGTARGVPTVVVGTFGKDAFEQLYGPLAKNQADGMEPIVTAFLEGELELTIS